MIYSLRRYISREEDKKFINKASYGSVKIMNGGTIYNRNNMIKHLFVKINELGIWNTVVSVIKREYYKILVGKN